MKIKVFALVTSLIALLGFQFGTVSTASAAPDTDLVLNAYRGFANQGIQYQVCNNGETAIKEIVFSISSTNIELVESFTSIFETPPADRGSIDHGTLTWTGQINGMTPDDPGTTEVDEYVAGQCVNILTRTAETGELGDEVTTTVSIVSATQVDDTVNTDSNPGNESVVLAPYTIVEKPDLRAEARLATTGEITPSTTVDYEITVENIGAGQYNDNGFFIFAFTLPPDATFDSFSDQDTSDVLDVSSCSSPGTVGELGFPGLSAYSDRRIVVCSLSADGGVLPANSDQYKFNVSIVAGASLAAGTADVVGILEGNDEDTLDLFSELTQGNDPLLLDNNGIFYLEYDPSALQATVARCEGQGETTTDGTGCFTITFNKLIYAPSFTTDDFDLGGVGNVSGFTQLNDFTWQVNVSGILPGQVLTLNLRLNEIQDYSAQQNSTQVLGINTIRFAQDATGTPASTNSASGTLAATGSNLDLTLTATLLILMGCFLARAFRKRLTV